MEKESVTVQVRMNKELHEKAKAEAKKLGLSFSSYVRYLLSKAKAPT